MKLATDEATNVTVIQRQAFVLFGISPHEAPRPTCPSPEVVKKDQEDQDQPKHLAFARSSWELAPSPPLLHFQSVVGLVISLVSLFNGDTAFTTQGPHAVGHANVNRKISTPPPDGTSWMNEIPEASICREPIIKQKDATKVHCIKETLRCHPPSCHHTP